MRGMVHYLLLSPFPPTLIIPSYDDALTLARALNDAILSASEANLKQF
jgi:hypothetical protein